jgi:CRISPR-associated protein Cmr3
MTIWLIEPRDPVIFRDGRPFLATPGAKAKTIAFPFPATIAGATRTRAGQDAAGRFDKGRISELLERQMRGPLLVELDADGEVQDWLLPAPHDALLLRTKSKDIAHVVPLTVVNTPNDALTDLALLTPLALVGAVEHIKEKPHSKAPAFWRWADYVAWLGMPVVQDVPLAVFGHAGPTRESRMHVSIEADAQTAQDGALFQTSGLEFVRAAKDDEATYPALSETRSLGLVIETDAGPTEGLDFLGGERRVVRWRHGPDALPACPPNVRKAIVQSKHCRLILATPACFAQGFLPDTGKLSQGGVTVCVQAVANNRYQTVSGWDYAFEQNGKQGRPKPTRRLAPAGSVYFIKLTGSDDAIGRFVDAVWLQAISDNAQDRRDGFGIALLGAWDGVPKPLIYRAGEAI